MSDVMQHILIVEDEQILRDVYRAVLLSQGYHVATAKNGVEAFSEIKLQTPDVILLDVLMPEMSGVEFMRNFNPERYPAVKIIINSNVSDLDVIGELLNMGAHTHVLKSDLTPNALVDLVESQSN